MYLLTPPPVFPSSAHPFAIVFLIVVVLPSAVTLGLIVGLVVRCLKKKARKSRS